MRDIRLIIYVCPLFGYAFACRAHIVIYYIAYCVLTDGCVTHSD